MMNKTIAYLLMAMLVFNLPVAMVYAKEANDVIADGDANTDIVSDVEPKSVVSPLNVRNVEKKVQELPKDKQEVFARLSRAEQKKILKSANFNQIMKGYQLKKVDKAFLFKQRIIAKEQINKAVEAYKEAKKAYIERTKAYKEDKKEFNEDKRKLKECKDQDTEECESLEAQVLEDAKKFLSDGINMLINHLKQIKEKVTSSETVEADKANEITINLDSKISELESALQGIESIQTKEELKEISRRVHRVWFEFKYKERLYVARLVHSKLWGILGRSKNLEQKLENILTKMEEKGIDVSDIDKEVTQFSEKISEAKTKYEEGKKILEEAYAAKDTTSDRKAILDKVKEAESILKEAKGFLKEANSILSKIIREIRSKGGEINNQIEEGYEVVETSTEDTVANEGE